MAPEIFERSLKVAQEQSTIEMPAPTAWPIILAFGLTLVFAGLVTSVSVGLLGAIFAVCACVGWFCEVLPHEKHETVPISHTVATVQTIRPRVARVPWKTEELQRARLPLEIYPISAGFKGGLAGGIVMAVLAMLYGIVSGDGIWYPVNLLSAGFFPARVTTGQIAAFHWDALLIAAILHLICSSLVGILYGATLPMLPKHPILFGGLIAPILWSGLIHIMLEALDPTLKQRVDWLWFVMSQMGFGVVAGFIASHQVRVHTWQHVPFPMRAGIEAAGTMHQKDGETNRQ